MSQLPETDPASRYVDMHSGEDFDHAAHAAAVLTSICHAVARQSGWWNRPDALDPMMTPTRLMLIVSEVGEAMEGHRKNLNDDKLPHRKMLEVELADAVIRIFDMAGGQGLDVAGAIAEKLRFNQVREDHRPEVRAQAGGKSY